MSPQRLSPDTRLAALEDCEAKIKSACRRGLEATCIIARELGKILEQELYKERTEEFSDYVTEHAHFTISTYRRIIAVSQTIELIQEAGLALPVNESQAAELGRLEPARRVAVWNNLITSTQRSDAPLTVRLVKHAVDLAEEPPAGIEIQMDNGDEEPAQEKQATGTVIPEIGIVLTEKGEAALARIRKIVGDDVADSIESGNLPLSERELRKWAEYDADMMRALQMYIVDERWSVAKAYAYETKPIDYATNAETMITIARNRGGSATLYLPGIAKITVALEN